jgi:zinc/manganese transport system permease protein
METLIYTAWDWVVGPFADFAFMRRALVATLALSLSAAPLGVFLTLRRMSLLGDALTHAVLPGVAIGFMVAGLSLSAMALGGVISGLLVAGLAGLVSKFTTLKEDASLAAMYLLALALGVTLISMHGTQLELLHILFGSALGVDNDGLMLSYHFDTPSGPTIIGCAGALYVSSLLIAPGSWLPRWWRAPHRVG